MYVCIYIYTISIYLSIYSQVSKLEGAADPPGSTLQPPLPMPPAGVDLSKAVEEIEKSFSAASAFVSGFGKVCLFLVFSIF